MRSKNSLIWAVLVLSIGGLLACGGGGGGGDTSSQTSISVSPGSLSFQAVEGDSLPAAARVQVRFAGDGVLIGYAPGVNPPSWLSVNGSATSTSTAVADIAVTDTYQVGTRSTSVRFVTGRSDGSNLKTFDLPVSYTVTASDLAITADAASMSFQAMSMDDPPPAQTLVTRFNGQSVSLFSAPAWLSVTPPANPNASPASFGVAVNRTSETAGTTLTGEIVFYTTRANSSIQRNVRVPVSCTFTASDLAITATPGPLNFRTVSQGKMPAEQSVVTQFNGQGAAVISAPYWLSVVAPGDPTVSPATFKVGVTTTAYSAGTSLSGEIILATTRNRGANQRTVSVPVTYSLEQAFGASAPTLAFSAIAKDPLGTQPSAGYAVDIVGGLARWRAEVSQPWVKLSLSSGEGPGSLRVTADGTDLGYGESTAQVTLTDDDSGQVRQFPVTLQKGATRMLVSTFNLPLVLNSASPSLPTQVVTLSDGLGGTQPSEAVSWSVVSSSPAWLKVSPLSGTTSPASQVTVSLDTAAMQTLVDGHYTGQIAVEGRAADGSIQMVTLSVTLDLSLPYVRAAAPYVGVSGLPGRLVVRGNGFPTLPSGITVSLGGTEIGPLTADGDSQVKVPYGALPPGRYLVEIKNAAGLSRTQAELVIMPPLPLAYQAMGSPAARRRLIWDAERHTLYAANVTMDTIEAYTFNGTGWVPQTPYVLPELRDLTLTPGGRSLLAVTRSKIHEIPLGGIWSAIPRATIAHIDCVEQFDRVEMTNGGIAFLEVRYPSCSGFTTSRLYDIYDHSLNYSNYSLGILYQGAIGGSADGSTVLGGSNGIYPAQALIRYDGLTNLISYTPVALQLRSVCLSGDGSRVIAQNNLVYDRDLAQVGQVPEGGVALVSRDSTRAFVYREEGGSPSLVVYDLAVNVGSGGTFPVLKTIPLADWPNVGTGNLDAIAMTGTPDDKIIFISGDARILVVPID